MYFSVWQVVFEECGIAGGTQMTRLPWAILGIIFYTIGYPAFLAQVRLSRLLAGYACCELVPIPPLTNSFCGATVKRS